MSLPYSNVLFEAVLNGACRSVLFAVMAWTLLKALPGLGAGVRYVVWYTTLVAALLFPAARLVTHWPVAEPPAQAFVTGFTARDLESVPAPAFQALPVTIPRGWSAWPFFGVWLVISGLLMARLLRGVRHLRRLKAVSEEPPETLRRWSEQWLQEDSGGRNARLRISPQIRLPVTAGMRNPAILFPSSLASKLAEEDAHSIWLHETAHVRRWDDWTKLGQRFLEAVLFFHPVVLWVGRRLQFERELACDEWVIRQTGRPLRYAACLTRLAEFASPESCAAPALPMAKDRQQIFRRVEMLLHRDRKIHSLRPGVAGAITLVLLVAGAVSLTLTSPVLVMAQAPEAPAEMPVSPQAPAPSGIAPQPSPAAAPQPGPESVRDDERKASQKASREQREKIQQLSIEIRRQVQEQIRPQVEEIRKLSEQIREKVQQQIRPATEKTKELTKQLQQQMLSDNPDEAVMQKLQENIRQIQEQAVKAAETDIRTLEEKIHRHELNIKVPEEQIRQLEEQIHKLEELIRIEHKVRRRASV
ncbi:MAG TPA: M56 family metallopeptidase [Bryobacteraceae bacterium]|nr:M56 family metallopeptidase [Bryobacteraceae bacterium]